MSEKGRENRLRRMAERQGLRLERSRRHDPRASSYGLYALKTWKTRQLVSEPGVRDDHAWTLDEVEQPPRGGRPRGPRHPPSVRVTPALTQALVPAALYGCGVGGDGAPLRSVGDFGTVAGVELGLGYAVAPAVRLEALLTSRPRFTFDGHANFLAPDREQSVSVDLSSLSGILAVYVDLPGVGVRPLGPLSPFVGGGLGATRVASGETRLTFPKTRTLVPGTRRTALTWRLTAGLGCRGAIGRRSISPGQVSGGCGRPTIAAAARWSERTPAQ